MSEEEFIKYIESLGFKNNYGGLYQYQYKEFRIDISPIDIFPSTNHFYNGSEWIVNESFSDLTPLENNFKRELRSIKLKQLLR